MSTSLMTREFAISEGWVPLAGLGGASCPLPHHPVLFSSPIPPSLDGSLQAPLLLRDPGGTGGHGGTAGVPDGEAVPRLTHPPPWGMWTEAYLYISKEKVLREEEEEEGIGLPGTDQRLGEWKTQRLPSPTPAVSFLDAQILLDRTILLQENKSPPPI